MRSIASTYLGLAITLSLCTAGAACDFSEPDPVALGVVRDSTGVRIVENSRTGLWQEGHKGLQEVLTIGVAAGIPEYEFGVVAGVDALSDGRIVVLDQLAQHVRIYDPAGRHRQTLGGPGSGPGELSPQTVGLFVGRGDTIVIPDVGNQRVTLTTPKGEFTSFRLPMQMGIPMAFDMAESGALVSQWRPMDFSDPSFEAPDTDLVLQLSYGGTITDTLLTPDRGGSLEMGEDGPRMKRFAAEPQWAMLGGDRIAYAMSDEYRIRLYGPGGQLERIVTFPHQPRPVSERDRRLVKRRIRTSLQRAGVSSETIIDQVLKSTSFSETWPAFTRLRGGPHGSLWVQRVQYLKDSEEDRKERNRTPLPDQYSGASEWDVFLADGRYAGMLKFPDRFTLFSIHADRIYGVYRDELEVPYVRVYRLNQRMRPLSPS